MQIVCAPGKEGAAEHIEASLGKSVSKVCLDSDNALGNHKAAKCCLCTCRQLKDTKVQFDEQPRQPARKRRRRTGGKNIGWSVRHGTTSSLLSAVSKCKQSAGPCSGASVGENSDSAGKLRSSAGNNNMSTAIVERLTRFPSSND